MPEAVTKQNDFVSLFEANAQDLPGVGTWLEGLRREAIASFATQGLPGKRVEAWRYTSTAPIAETTFALAEHGAAKVTADDLAPYTFPSVVANRFVFVDGHFAPALSTREGLPDGVSVRTLSEVLAEEPDALEGRLAGAEAFEGAPFLALNTALLTDGAFVEIAPNTVVEGAIHLLFVATGGGLVSSPRLVVRAGTSSEATLLESHVTVGGGKALVNAASDVVLEDDATLRHVKLQRHADEVFQITSSEVVQGRDATYDAHQVDLGAAFVRNMVHATIGGPGGHTNLNGLFMPRDRQHVDNFTQVDHVAPHCTSHELYKGILDDDATGVFRGRIHVHPGAQKTDAIQHNPNLLLSDRAIANSLPQLEIYADDVKCTHGSTTGQLDEDALFYLRTRGIDEATARSILTYAFASDVVSAVTPEPVRRALIDLVLDRLPNGRAVEEALR